MIDKDKIKALAFDFGGTLDSPFLHWMSIYIKLYNEALGLNLSRENFRDAYVYAERKMESDNPISSTHTLLETQLFKAKYQFDYLQATNVITVIDEEKEHLIELAAQTVTNYAAHYALLSKQVLVQLGKKYKLLLVSNYYGNVRQVVEDFGLDQLFVSITDSTIEDVRKPDPRLWQIAIERVGLEPNEVVIIGDSYKNDILPGLEIGAQVIQGVPQTNVDDSVTHTTITDLSQLLQIV